MLDLIIKNGRVVNANGISLLDIGVKNEKIVELAPKLTETAAARIIDVEDRFVFPGFIDVHTHMGIPIMDTFSCDNFKTGSMAAACGGVTTIIDFTVQKPGQSVQQSIDDRMNLAFGKSHIDFGLHVNITDQPDQRLAEIPAIIKKGIRAFKVFSTYREAGMMISWEDFRDVLRVVGRNGGLLFLHAEDNDLVESLT